MHNSKRSAKQPRSNVANRQLEELDALIPQLEAEKARLEEEMCSGTLNTDQLIAHSRRIEELIAELDEKGMRWLELSEIEG